MKTLNKGFTLIELMVVIVIIGILAAVAIPKLLGMTDKAKASGVVQVLRTYTNVQLANVAQSNQVLPTIQKMGITPVAGVYEKNGFVFAETVVGTLTGTSIGPLGNGCAAGTVWAVNIALNGDYTRTIAGVAPNNLATTPCEKLTPNFR